MALATRSDISPEFNYVDYLTRSRAKYQADIDGGAVTGDRLEATKALVVALTDALAAEAAR